MDKSIKAIIPHFLHLVFSAFEDSKYNFDLKYSSIEDRPKPVAPMEWKHRFFHLAIVLLRLTGDGLSCRRNHIGLPPHLRDSDQQKVHILFIEESIIKIIKFLFYLGNIKMKIPNF